MPIAVIINTAATHVTANSTASISPSIPVLVEFSINEPGGKTNATNSSELLGVRSRLLTVQGHLCVVIYIR